MIQRSYVDYPQHLFQPLGDLPVRLAGCGVTGRVIVGKNASCRVMLQGRLDDLPGMDAGPVDGAAKQFFKFDDAVPIVELC